MYGSKTKRIEPGGVTFVASLAQSIFKIAYWFTLTWNIWRKYVQASGKLRLTNRCKIRKILIFRLTLFIPSGSIISASRQSDNWISRYSTDYHQVIVDRKTFSLCRLTFVIENFVLKEVSYQCVNAKNC